MRKLLCLFLFLILSFLTACSPVDIENNKTKIDEIVVINAVKENVSELQRDDLKNNVSFNESFKEVSEINEEFEEIEKVEEFDEYDYGVEIDECMLIEDDLDFNNCIENLDENYDLDYDENWDDDEFIDSYEGEYDYQLENDGGIVNITFLVKNYSLIVLNQNEELYGPGMMIWEEVKKIVPREEIDEEIRRFMVFKDSSEEEGLAFVEPVDYENSNWIFAVNIAPIKKDGENLIFNDQFYYTMIHEFAHILSLNDEQVNSQINKENCLNLYYIDEGCPNKNSYINIFFDKFWRDRYDKKFDVLQHEIENVNEELQEELYEENKEDFITFYSSTNAVEDFSESFTAFVVEKKPVSKSKLYEEKILFFYEFEELVLLRDEIRTTLREIDSSFIDKKYTDFE